ncbi:hypothetical protein PFISCL1PPCAC_5920 [Pristionchus fissidentatus]|uniref:Uncharacterized protein n=1 Tax=Pristionchus fissidentatus TaxID=1538716 RepID=A0AAV5V8V0_9BILA|nr:hypothetical protein PFISCL1PPCAC_5920 [Pristionchus fissidentatus]
MDQTKRSRACEHELHRLMQLIEKIPSRDINGTLASEEALIVFEDEIEPNYDMNALTTSALGLPGGKGGADQTLLEKVISILSSLCVEGEELVDEAGHSILPPLLLYGEEEYDGNDDPPPSSSSLPECASLKTISAFVPFLLEISLFLGRVSAVTRSILMQIHAFHSLGSSDLLSAGDRSLNRCWRVLGDLLSVLIQTDEVITSRPLLKQQWNSYAKSMETARHNPSQFGTTESSLRPFIVAMQTIEAQIIAAQSFRNCYEQSFGAIDDDKEFGVRMREIIMEGYEQWERAAAIDVPDKRRLTSLVALCTFHQLHFGGRDKKMVKAIWNSHKKIILYHLVGDLIWSPFSFLLRECPVTIEIADKKAIALVNGALSTLYEQQSDALLEEAFALVGPSKEWAASFRLDTWNNRSRDAAECLRVADVVLKGARLADTQSRLLKTLLNCAGRGEEIVMRRSMMGKVMAVVQSIKLISSTFSSFWPAVIDVSQQACQQWRCHIISALDHGRILLREEGEKGIHSIEALNVAATVLLSSASRARLVVASVALDIANCKKLRSLPEWPQLNSLLSRLETLSRPRRLIARVCDCSFLYFHRHLFRLYFGTLLQDRPPIEEITLTFLSITDCALLAKRAGEAGRKGRHGERKREEKRDGVVRAMQKEIWTAFREEFLSGLCGEIENDLRVLSHRHLKVDERDKTPAEQHAFFTRILKSTTTMRILDRSLSVRDFVEEYLERTFYNLTAVSLHDAHTYTKMAMMAEFRYGLRPLDGRLPHSIINQGLDVVNVMKALNTFTATYNYDLYHNLFVEKRSSSRTLHILSWEHISNSLRMHGMGVVNTSVNLAYQLLRKKLSIVNEFMDDEHVKAMLSGESKYFEENRKQLRKMYPVKRAERLNNAMGELGRVGGEEGETYFDRFRVTITQLGNALGFVRSMKAAADLVVNDALVYDRQEEKEENEEERERSSMDDGTEMVRRLLRENKDQDARNRQYIEKLVSFFRDSFSSSSSFSHLSPFAIVSPALTINYVDHMLSCRERSKRRAPSAPIGGGSSQAPSSSVGGAETKELTYVDDGFVLGMTYLLTVVNCWESFAALNWFRSVLRRVEEERRRLDELSRNAEGGKTSNLKMNQLDCYEKEFKLLSYSFQSARMFFAIDDEEKEEEMKEDDEN